ncbi:retrotransposon protein, putative, ty1-copia subclass [Tanacetum coccineum]
MVRSMMSQTTLPKSFWDYALETVARILNMVPTKKVEKTPYEVWHGQAPKLSYLKVWGCEALVKNSLINQEASRSLKDLEIIQEEDTHPSIDTSLNHKEDDLEIDDNLKVIFNSHSQSWETTFSVTRCNILPWKLFCIEDLGSFCKCEIIRPDVTSRSEPNKAIPQNPDAGYLTDADDLKSQTGYVFVLNGGAVDWKSAKQIIFATSSAEAEYIVAYDASKEAV